MDIENLSDAEVSNLFEKCSRRLGYFHLMLLSVDDVRERLEELADGEPEPTEEQIRQACAYVCRKLDGNDWQNALDWACQVSKRLAAEGVQP